MKEEDVKRIGNAFDKLAKSEALYRLWFGPIPLVSERMPMNTPSDSTIEPTDTTSGKEE